jgi:hypothetical protein
VEPSGNSSAAQAFLRLHAYGVREGGLEDALRILAGFQPHLEQAGVSFSAMLAALDFHLGPSTEIAIVGDPAGADTRALLETVRAKPRPNAVLALAAPRDVDALAGRIPLLQGRQAIGGRATAYVCRDLACKLPVHTPAELEAQLAGA